jgi:hypothetical protein
MMPAYGQEKKILLQVGRCPRTQSQRVSALHIDRKAHLERAWREQKVSMASQLRRLPSLVIQIQSLKQLLEKRCPALQDADARSLPGVVASSSTAEINTLSQLEQVVQQAGSQIVVVAFYSRVSIDRRLKDRSDPVGHEGPHTFTSWKSKGESAFGPAGTYVWQ